MRTSDLVKSNGRVQKKRRDQHMRKRETDKKMVEKLPKFGHRIQRPIIPI